MGSTGPLGLMVMKQQSPLPPRGAGGVGDESPSGWLNGIIDSENLADFVGTAVSYAAFTSLPLVQWDVTLPGINLTAEHLFFIGYCIKVCVSQYVVNEKYTPDPSRCIVPIMNMAEFSDAFECAPGSRMDPSKKCAFWP
ncbi:hypothetical protein MRX96_049692 [Rhipicephalus microplus]